MKKNIFKNIFILLILVIIPLMLIIGAASWFVVSEYKTKPLYNPNSAFYKYLHNQSAYYDGSEKFPSCEEIDLSNENISFKWRVYGTTADEKNYVTDGSKPVYVGDYLILFNSSSDQTNFEATEVLFKILPGTPEIEQWPTYLPMFYGNEYTVDANNPGSSKIDGVFKPVGSPTQVNTTYDGSGLLPTINFKITVVFTPNDSNYAEVTNEDVPIKLYAVADINSSFYATIDDALVAAKNNSNADTINVMLKPNGIILDDKYAKTIGITGLTSFTLSGSDVLLVPYIQSGSGTSFTYNSTVTGKNKKGVDKEQLKKDDGKTPIEWGALNTYTEEAKKDQYGNYMYKKEYDEEVRTLYKIVPEANITFTSKVDNANYYYTYTEKVDGVSTLKTIGVYYTEKNDELYCTGVNSSNFADTNTNQKVEDQKTFLMNSIAIGQNVNLIIDNGSTLKVTGIIGQSGLGLQGHTSREYAELLMLDGSSIINEGLIIVGGYIKEASIDEKNNYIYYNNKDWNKPVYSAPSINDKDKVYKSSLTVTSNGEIRMPFVVHDYRGGSSTTATYIGNKTYGLSQLYEIKNVKGNVFPFNRFSLPNVQTKLIIEAGGRLLGYADIYTGAVAALVKAQHNLSEVILIDDTTDAFIQLKSGNMVCECVMKTPGLTTNAYNSSKTTITFSGEFEMNSLALNMKVAIIDATVTSQDILFPISDLYDIILDNCDAKINVNLKLLPGCNIVVRSNSTLIMGDNVESSIIVYSDFEDKAAINPLYPKSSQLDQIGAKLYNDGFIRLGSKCTFGGEIYSFGLNGEIEIDTSANLYISSPDGSGSMTLKNNGFLNYDFIFTFNQSSITEERLKLKLYSNGIINDYVTEVRNATTYKSIKGGNNEYGWQAIFANVNFYNELNELIDFDIEKINLFDPVGNFGVSVENVEKPNMTRKHFTYIWKVTGNIIDNIIYGDVNFYVQYTPINYQSTIKYVFYDDLGNDISSIVTNDSQNPTGKYTYNIETNNIALYNPNIDGEYNFAGWYMNYDQDNNLFVNNISTFDGSNYLSELTSAPSEIIIYGKFTSSGTITIEYTKGENCPSNVNDFTHTNISINDVSNYTIPNQMDYTIYNDNDSTNISNPTYFKGWKLSGSDDLITIEQLREKLATLKNNDKITLIAVWGNKYFITFESTTYNDTDYYMPGYDITIDKMPSIEGVGKLVWFVQSTNEPVNNISIAADKVIEGSGSTYNGDIYYPVKIRYTTDAYTKIITSSTSIILDNNGTSVYTFSEIANNQEENNIFIMSKEKTIIEFAGEGTNGGTFDKITCNKYEVKATDNVVKVESTGSKTDSGSCVTGDTLITLADGSKKRIDQLSIDDILLAFNHFTGVYEPTRLAALVYHGDDVHNVMKLHFDDGSYIELIGRHGLFNVTLNEYSHFDLSTCYNYIGHEFIKYNNGVNTKVKLEKVEIIQKYVGSYTLITSENLNSLANDMLNITTGMFGLYNIFEYDENHMFDSQKYEEDIEKYGLYDYSVFEKYCEEKTFIDFGGKYFAVSIGKGYVDFETIVGYIYWLENMVQNGEAQTK